MRKNAGLILVAGILFLSLSRLASAENFVFRTETDIMGSRSLGFDPTVHLLPAVTNTDVNAGPCFTCPNSNAGGTTAGALTNSMFGEIRLNNNADLGNQSFSPASQNMLLPTETACGENCNDSGAFTVNLDLPIQNFLSDGTAVTDTNPVVFGAVGKAGVKIKFNSLFDFKEDGTNTFEQSISQTTFTGGIGRDGSDGNEMQLADFEAHGENPPNARNFTSSGEIFWTQTIEEGGFLLGPMSGSFVYKDDAQPPSSSAPTGSGQTEGLPNSLP